MATLQTNNGPASRTEAGDHVLNAAESLGAAGKKPIAGRLAAFEKAHLAFVSADGVVKAADRTIRAQQAKVGEADVVQDEGVDALATAAVGEGMPRLAPFKLFGFDSPGSIKKMGHTAEAKVVLALAAKVLKRKPPLPKSRKAAKALAAAGKAVLAAAAPLEGLEKKRKTAMSKRGAVELAWEKAFAAVKRGARAAEDDGAIGLYETLFGSAPAKAKPSKKAIAAKKAKLDAKKVDATRAAAKKAAPRPIVDEEETPA